MRPAVTQPPEEETAARYDTLEAEIPCAVN